MKRLVLIDGNALLHRAYHATPPFSTSKGELINAVYGFSSMLFKTFDELKPDFLAIAWDEKGPTFRHQAYTQYKATRGPTEDGLTTQYKRVHEVIKAFNVPEFSVSGYEADDLIGTLAVQATKKSSKGRSAYGRDLEVVIVTGDKDIMQVIDEKIKILMPKKTLTDVGLYGIEEFVLRFGFLPKQLIEYKALAGDNSDNIPGVPGIGEVSATKLIHKFESIEKIYLPENLKTLPERMQKLLAEGAESAVMSKKLATLDLEAPIELDLKACEMHDYDPNKVKALFEELEFKSLIARLPGQPVTLSSNVILNLPANASVALQAGEMKDIYSSTASQSDKGKFQNDSRSVTSDLDLAVLPILEKMTKTGVLIDLKFLNKLGKELKSRLFVIEKDIYSKVGHEFNLNSPKQLQVILFDELKLPVFKKTKTGRSTAEETLRELSDAHPIMPLLLEYRQLFKLVSTYIDALPKSIKEDGRVHSTFNVEGAATGRLSSKDPNLQNIPVGSGGGEIRKAFIAPKGKVLFGADYSQIELRIMAHLSDDSELKKAFQNNEDIHVSTASKIFKVDLNQVTKDQRNVGKTMNFATLYGQGPHALARQLKVSFEIARLYIDEYFNQYAKIQQWMVKTLEKATIDGYVETLWGRKRFMPELQSQNRIFRSAGERAAVNMPVQGSAADMIKKAMVEIDNECKMNNLQCTMILQVHDELLFECNENSVKEVAKMVKEKMENALKLSVPVIVDLKVGPNWGEMKPIKL